LELLQDVQIDNKLAHSHWLGATQHQDAKECVNILQAKKADCLIVDHYALDEDWHNELNRYCDKLIVIDDIADRKFECDVLLNQNLGACEDDYNNKIPNESTLLLGCDYVLLRPEFAKLREQALKKRENTKDIKNILISMGGSDPDNLTYNILQNINNDFNITVVLGSSIPHIEMIKSYAINKNINVIVDANNMAELMLNADLSIGAGGSTSWERCTLGLPTLLFITADNQKDVAKNLEKVGAVKIVKDLKQDLYFILSNLNAWKVMSNKASQVSDGLGTNQVAEYILKI